MAIHVTPLVIASHFIVGFLHASGWVYFEYKETGKLKSDHYNWLEVVSGFITVVIMGYTGILVLIACFAMVLAITAIQIIFWTIWALFEKAETIKWPSMAKVGLYTFFFLFLGGLITECTAPREGANCRDGSYSYATGRGACSWHGGVSSWDEDYWWE